MTQLYKPFNTEEELNLDNFAAILHDSESRSDCLGYILRTHDHHVHTRIATVPLSCSDTAEAISKYNKLLRICRTTRGDWLSLVRADTTDYDSTAFYVIANTGNLVGFLADFEAQI